MERLSFRGVPIIWDSESDYKDSVLLIPKEKYEALQKMESMGIPLIAENALAVIIHGEAALKWLDKDLLDS